MTDSKFDVTPSQLNMEVIGVVREIDVEHDGVEEGGYSL